MVAACRCSISGPNAHTIGVQPIYQVGRAIVFHFTLSKLDLRTFTWTPTASPNQFPTHRMCTKSILSTDCVLSKVAGEGA